MVCRTVVVSNNPRIHALPMTSGQRELLSTSLAVLQHARDRIHQGWQLTHHPLYGNFRPNQQPYRTLVLQGFGQLDLAGGGSVHMQSLHLIEEALTVYSSGTILTPEDAPECLRHDCSLLDVALIRTALDQAGVL